MKNLGLIKLSGEFANFLLEASVVKSVDTITCSNQACGKERMDSQ